MRCFVAIDVDELILSEFEKLQSELRESVEVKKGKVKWVKPHAVHLTLKFLGEVKDTDVPAICEVVREVAAEHSPFELVVESVGSFGGRSPRVLWVGMGEGREKLEALQGQIDEQLVDLGFRQENRKFRGHLTLIRSKAAGFKLKEAAEDYKEYSLGSFRADSVCVYESNLTKAGPEYNVLCNYSLAG